jgi:hypothetical protein
MATMTTSVRKHITVKERHEDWVDENNINLSRFVQDAIDDELGHYDT